MVYVLDNDNNPLMPTRRSGMVRRLLKRGLASVVSRTPFTIKIQNPSGSQKQDVTLGVDPGSKFMGLSASTEKREFFSAYVILRSDIPNKIAARREARRSRRYRKTRYRKARFLNRTRSKKKGWLAPSVRHKVDTHIRLIGKVFRLLPVTKIIIETAQFDIRKIMNPGIKGVEYQTGEQYGFWNTREYVLTRDGHKCANCQGKSGDKILNVHHIESRLTGGDAPNNLITLCETCHREYHKSEIKLSPKIRRGMAFRDAAAVNTMRWALYDAAKAVFPGVDVTLTFGYLTKCRRINKGLPKSETSDAFCIAGNLGAKRNAKSFALRQVPRHSRSLHVMKPAKHGKRRSAIAPHWIGKSRLQRFDLIKWNGVKAFISGSTAGRTILRDIYGKLVTPTASVNAKIVKFLARKHSGFLVI